MYSTHADRNEYCDLFDLKEDEKTVNVAYL